MIYDDKKNDWAAVYEYHKNIKQSIKVLRYQLYLAKKQSILFAHMVAYQSM